MTTDHYRFLLRVRTFTAATAIAAIYGMAQCYLIDLVCRAKRRM